MPDNVFIDSNLFVYAAFKDASEPKCEVASAFIRELPGDITISVQVLSEFYNVLLKRKVADSVIQQMLLDVLNDVRCVDLTSGTVKSAWILRCKYNYSYYDTLILASALESDCTILFSEDFQHGQTIEGKMTILNPFINK